MFDKAKYKKRIIDKTIERYLKLFGAICIEGPKYCGKTWTSSFHSKSFFYVGDPSNNFENRSNAEIFPFKVLNGEKPRLIDEWQEVPSLWDATRAFVDSDDQKGKIILIGSSTPATKGIMHSGTGRICTIKMNTMSLYESGDSNGSISLRNLFIGKFKPDLYEKIKIENLAYLICRGGWPGNLKLNNKESNTIAINYIENILKIDLSQLDKNLDYNKHKAKLILKSLARNESTTVSNETILKDIIENDSSSISKHTLAKYLDAFKRLFLLDNQEPFSINVRSSLRVKQMEKRHFFDPSITCALLKLTPEKLLNDLQTFGYMFEALVARDLKIYAQANNAKLYHYQDYKNNEIDAIIELENGDWVAIEIKLSMNKAQEASDNLTRVCNIITNSGAKAPLIKIVIYGYGNMAYQDKNGVYIIPITALKD